MANVYDSVVRFEQKGINTPEMNISESTDILEEVAEDEAYDTYESSKPEDENVAIYASKKERDYGVLLFSFIAVVYAIVSSIHIELKSKK